MKPTIPLLLYFSGGELRDHTIGVVSKQTILTKLASLQGLPATAPRA
jgi:hypothetical protein